MKKQLFTIIAVFIFLTSCKKSLQSFDPLDSGKIERKLTIKDVAKELNFTINPNVEGQILKQFGSVESWRTKIIDFRKSKESKKMAYKENRTTTDGDNTYSLWAYDEFGFLSTFPVGADEYILDAAEAQGFDFGSCDRAGVGPTCVARLRSGLIDGYNQSYLNDCQLEAGFLLPCVSYALSDCQITFLQETELDNFNQSYSNEPCNNMGQYEMNFCSMSSTDASRWHQDMMWHSGPEYYVYHGGSSNAYYLGGEELKNDNPKWKFHTQKIYGGFVLGWTAFFNAVYFKDSPTNSWRFKSFSYDHTFLTDGQNPPCLNTVMTVNTATCNIHHQGQYASCRLNYSLRLEIQGLGWTIINEPPREIVQTFTPQP